MFLTIIVFLIILGVLIFVHELGHFVVARRSGVKAEEFGFGFPPRVIGIYKEKGKWKWVFGKKEIETKETIYSINLIPLGGFVKIKGEDGNFSQDADSFPSKKWTKRIKILAAGVTMNFFLAWLLIWGAMLLGIPEGIDSSTGYYPNSKIQLSEIAKDSPAEKAGLKVGDEVLKKQTINGQEVAIDKVGGLIEIINDNKGQEMTLVVERGGDTLKTKIIPREEYPENQGPIGVALVETDQVQYPFFEAGIRSFLMVFELIGAMIAGIFFILKQLIMGSSVGVEVTGPVGIAVMTKQVTQLGLVYILQFAAILSINLGIINALPIPALDGGRILFILIERLKGSPVSQKTEQVFHTVGFLLLIGLMVVVTFKDVWGLIK